MNKRIFFITTLILTTVLFVPGCLVEKVKNFFSKTNKEDILAKVNKNGKEIVIASCKDFENMTEYMENVFPELKLLSLQPSDKQEMIYKGLLEENIVMGYLIKEYIHNNKINETEDFKNKHKEYMRFMENNFYNSIFQEDILKNIHIKDEVAKDYYENNKNEFVGNPFVKDMPGIEAKLMLMIDGKTLKDCEKKLKSKEKDKDIIELERVNKNSKGLETVYMLLEDMKDGEVKQLDQPGGMVFAVYRVKNHKGSWKDYSMVSEQVKNLLKYKETQNAYLNKIKELKEKYKVFINDECLIKIIKNKLTKTSDLEIQSAIKDVEEKVVEAAIEEEIKEEVKEKMEELKK